MEQQQVTEGLRLSLIATPLAARQAVTDICDHVERPDLPPARLDDIRIVVAEALNNIVEHAYAARAPGRIRVWVRSVPGAIEIGLFDFGAPLPHLMLPEAHAPVLPSDLADLPEGGFGWHMIRSLADHVAYEHRAGCNRLILRFNLSECDIG